MGVKSKLKLVEQLKFIDVAYDKLKKDIKDNLTTFESNDIYYGIPGHHRMQNDIMRLRRELSELSKMLDPTVEYK